jgi:hypothetical protein
MPFMLIAAIIGEAAIYGAAYFAPLNNISIPVVSCVAGTTAALWVLIINQRWSEPHERTRYMWENHIRLRAVISLVVAGLAIIAMSYKLNESPYCLTAVAGAAMVQTVILFAVLSTGIVLEAIQKGKKA